MAIPVKGSCHCGKVRLEGPSLPPWIVQCGCEICTKLGALWAYYPDGAVTVVGDTIIYTCNNKVIGFHHCPTCGCLTHWRTLVKDFGRMAMNARLLEESQMAAIPIRAIAGPTPAVFGDKWPPA